MRSGKVCCQFYPTCYCNDVPPEDERYARIQRLPHEELDLDTIFSGFERRRRRRNALMLMIGTLVVLVLLGVALAGCDPSDGRGGEEEPPAPTTTEMFTVIHPPQRAGGIYDNN